MLTCCPARVHGRSGRPWALAHHPLGASNATVLGTLRTSAPRPALGYMLDRPYLQGPGAPSPLFALGRDTCWAGVDFPDYIAAAATSRRAPPGGLSREPAENPGSKSGLQGLVDYSTTHCPTRSTLDAVLLCRLWVGGACLNIGAGLRATQTAAQKLLCAEGRGRDGTSFCLRHWPGGSREHRARSLDPRTRAACDPNLPRPFLAV